MSSLETVVVTATRTEKSQDEAPVHTEVVSGDEIRKTHAHTLKEALENVPGLQLREVHGKSGYELSLQGLSSDQVLVLIDGLPIAASTGSTVDLSQYELSEVDHIEVVKGASSAQYGSSAMGGVINVITRRISAGFSGSAQADMGSYGKQNVSGHSAAMGSRSTQARVEGGMQTLRARLAGSVLDDRGFTIAPDAWTRQGDAATRQQYEARLDWQPVRQNGFWLTSGRYLENDDSRYTFYAPPNLIPQNRAEDITRDRHTAGGKWSFDNGLAVQAKGLDEHYDSRSLEYSSGVNTATRLSSQHINHFTAQVDLPPWQRQLLQAGVDWHRETLSQSSNGVSEIAGNQDAMRESREAFAQDDIFLGDRVELVAGGRVQDDSDFGSYAVPKVAVRVQVLETADWQGTLRASYGEGYRVPNLKERHYVFDHSALGYMVLGNPGLRPESSQSWQMGSAFRFHDVLALDINLFRNDVKDLIEVDLDNYRLVNNIAVYSYRNVARARTQGVESAVRWQAAGALAFNAAYTLTASQDLSGGGELTRRPRHMARLGADWSATENTGVTLRARYQGSELVDSKASTYSPAWAMVDLAVNQKLPQGVGGFVGINNIFNRQRNFSDANDFGPLVGRFIYLGLRYDWGSSKP